MSADEKPSVILKSLEEGVSFYMVKPISLDDVKQVWQYAITPKQTRTIIRPQFSIDKPSKKEIIKLSKSERTKNKTKKAKETRVPQTSIAKRKAKVVWTNSLHNRFLQAIRLIGLDSKSMILYNLTPNFCPSLMFLICSFQRQFQRRSLSS